ncbi:LOW QUALITY PROTEIN: hypothetical protein ACHAWO_010326 [Cyclotella atomus]|uniref:Uncharacterized protein n=1 Tax=Cyclotella atomus TaxID=382360 RepID=A0ABD3Q969_9STRA
MTEVQVTRYVLNNEGVPLDAECMVYFSEWPLADLLFIFCYNVDNILSANYISIAYTRIEFNLQLSAHGCEHTSNMADAILPFKGDKLKYSLIKQCLIQYDEITTTESNVLRKYGSGKTSNKWARAVEQDCKEPSACSTCGSWWSDFSTDIAEANSIANYSLFTQKILDGLMESMSTGGSKVAIGL